MIYINDFYSFISGGVIHKDANIANFKEVNTPMSFAVEPDYKGVIPPMQLRRMSKPIKLSIAAVKNILSNNQSQNLGAINVGTAYGMLSDSEVFLRQLVLQNEEMLTPTAFIQSTQNTIGGQIALMLNCDAHNMTFVQRGHSFEHALLDIELMDEEDDKEYIVGGVDEMTPHFYDILNALMYKYDKNYHGDLKLGEAASFFRVSLQPKEDTICKLICFEMLKAKDKNGVLDLVKDSLKQHNIDDLDNTLWIIGDANDTIYNNMYKHTLDTLGITDVFHFKKYSGDFPTVSSAGLAFSINLLISNPTKKIIFLNNYLKYWSLYILER
jgi:3-oxoacyl-[acyl-carrier-protein] synthase II